MNMGSLKNPITQDLLGLLGHQGMPGVQVPPNYNNVLVFCPVRGKP